MVAVYPPALTMTRSITQMFDSDGQDQVTMIGRCQYPGIVNSVEMIPNWTMAGANTNSRTWTLYNRGTAGAGTTAIATLALTSGVNLTKFVPKVVTISAANATVAAGDILEWESLHVGTGIPEVGGTIVVQQSLGS